MKKTTYYTVKYFLTEDFPLDYKEITLADINKKEMARYERECEFIKSKQILSQYDF